ncbi:polyhydroxyalkanoate synthesis repressor PhaR [Marivibrio halodurans]|nr:polyhydroxyalkanoate synthesis repressor PhaR [Marivibrio halodurans]
MADQRGSDAKPGPSPGDMPGKAGAKGAGSQASGQATDGTSAPVTIKKYANRRLYNTATSSYVTLETLCGMVKDGVEFVVYDAKTGEDITRSVLTQIIVEEEAKTGQNLLPIGFLRQLIGFYGDNMQQMMLPQYLDLSLRSFAENQEKMRSYMSDTFGAVFPFGQMEEMGKRNMEIFENAMRAFRPFSPDLSGGGPAGAPRSAPQPRGEADRQDAADQAERVKALQDQLSEMQRQLQDMQKK